MPLMIGVSGHHPGHRLGRAERGAGQLQPPGHLTDLRELGETDLFSECVDTGRGVAGEHVGHRHRLLVMGGHVLGETDVAVGQQWLWCGFAAVRDRGRYTDGSRRSAMKPLSSTLPFPLLTAPSSTMRDPLSVKAIPSGFSIVLGSDISRSTSPSKTYRRPLE